MSRIRHRLTYSNVISTVCLFLLIGGGTAFAASELGKESIGSRQLKKEAVTPAKLSAKAKSALTGPAGPAGPKGATGAAGPAGPQGPAGLSATGINGAPVRIVAGATTPGATNWQLYNGGQGLYVDIDTSAAGFQTTPAYIVTVSGNANNWNLVGGSSPYFATATGFRVYIRNADWSYLSVSGANSNQWIVNWAAFGN
jgi:hypothetical protein